MPFAYAEQTANKNMDTHGPHRPVRAEKAHENRDGIAILHIGFYAFGEQTVFRLFFARTVFGFHDLVLSDFCSDHRIDIKSLLGTGEHLAVLQVLGQMRTSLAIFREVFYHFVWSVRSVCGMIPG